MHGRTRCQFYPGSADWARCARSRQAVSIPVVVNGDIASFEEARAALARIRRRRRDDRTRRPGAAVVSRPGRALSRRRAARAAPSLEVQLRIIATLYDEMLAHHGERIGVKHARKHLGWALDAAAATAGPARGALKHWRAPRCLTAPDRRARPSAGSADAFDALAWRAAA